MKRSRSKDEGVGWVVLALSLLAAFGVGTWVIYSPEFGFKGQVGGLALGGVTGVAVYLLFDRISRR